MNKHDMQTQRDWQRENKREIAPTEPHYRRIAPPSRRPVRLEQVAEPPPAELEK